MKNYIENSIACKIVKKVCVIGMTVFSSMLYICVLSMFYDFGLYGTQAFEEMIRAGAYFSGVFAATYVCFSAALAIMCGIEKRKIKKSISQTIKGC